ncbi:co-chaperone GroES [Helicobacter sp. MIT 99-5507]|uniref:co-chaperone GroES n=1 Tax=Helicobacter sp. MIT 99-5507 TaxID=152489 RepID=UPI000E1F3F93|nr:co-chaperone GroES [Helicobacter sp. MIT 99-5507]RDU56536.1 co-chaperone GroES [Helicobacter sp. MIT 99-5507]
MKFRPLDKRVLLERVEEETKTSSGIIIPDNAKEKPLVGIVRAISKKLEKESEIKVGDSVVFDKYKGSEIKIDNKLYVVIDEEDLLGILG